MEFPQSVIDQIYAAVTSQIYTRRPVYEWWTFEVKLSEPPDMRTFEELAADCARALDEACAE